MGVTVLKMSSHPHWPGKAGSKVQVSSGVSQTKGKKEEDPQGRFLVLFLDIMVVHSPYHSKATAKT